MKKARIIIISIAILLVVSLACGVIYVMGTPEYTLAKVVDDVKESGMDGLQPYLTEDAQEVVDMISTITENELVSSILGLFNQNDSVSVLKTKIQEMEWDIQDIEKDKENAIFVLAFNYDNSLTGTIEVSMIHTDDGWKIDGLGMPKFK